MALHTALHTPRQPEGAAAAQLPSSSSQASAGSCRSSLSEIHVTTPTHQNAAPTRQNVASRDEQPAAVWAALMMASGASGTRAGRQPAGPTSWQAALRASAWRSSNHSARGRPARRSRLGVGSSQLKKTAERHRPADERCGSARWHKLAAEGAAAAADEGAVEELRTPVFLPDRPACNGKGKGKGKGGEEPPQA